MDVNEKINCYFDEINKLISTYLSYINFKNPSNYAYGAAGFHVLTLPYFMLKAIKTIKAYKIREY